MATLTIELPDTMKDYVDREVGAGRFKDSSALVQMLIADAIRIQTRNQIDDALLEAVAQIDRGECTPWQPGEDRKLLEEMIRQRSANGSK